MKAEFLKLKEEMKQELKTFKQTQERELRVDIRELRTEQRTQAQSLEYAHKEIEDLKVKLSAEQTKNTKLENENRELQARNMALEATITDFEKRLIQMEQYSRNANLEIQGVPKAVNENVTEILSTLGTAISETITEADIVTCHRVPTRNPEKSSIVVQFKSRMKRDSALKKARKLRLTNKDIGIDNPSPVYVNEHLCPAQKKLLGMAVKRKYECNWKSVWTFNGKIFARKNDSSDAVHISCERDLGKIRSTQSDNSAASPSASALEQGMISS